MTGDGGRDLDPDYALWVQSSRARTPWHRYGLPQHRTERRCRVLVLWIVTASLLVGAPLAWFAR